MSEIDLNFKMEKFKKVQKKLNDDVQKKDKPKMWDDMDKYEKEEKEIIYSDDELSDEGKKRRTDFRKLEKKKGKNAKLQFKRSQIKDYQIGLRNHRMEPKKWRHYLEPPKLSMNVQQTVDYLKHKAKVDDFHLPLGLKKVGIKSIKTLYQRGARAQLDLVIGFLETGKVPDWIFRKHEILMKKEQHEFKGTVQDYLH